MSSSLLWEIFILITPSKGFEGITVEQDVGSTVEITRYCTGTNFKVETNKKYGLAGDKALTIPKVPFGRHFRCISHASPRF